jgi:protocatechuate 3,4-dioxygenase beta subunit
VLLGFHPFAWRARRAHAMARGSDVRRRIESLHRRVFRSPLPRRFTVPAIIASGLCVVLIGGVGFTRAGQSGSTNGPAAPAPGAAVARAQEAKTTPAGGPRAKADATTPAATLSASGTVVDAAHKPVAGASVILREWSAYRVLGMVSEVEGLFRGDEIPDTLAETKTDADGRFRFERVPAPGFPHLPEVGQSVFPWDVVALAPGRGLAWAQLTHHNQRTPITLTLGDEGTLRGRVVEPGGRPVGGAKVKVFGIGPLGQTGGNSGRTGDRLNLTWSAFPLGAKTDTDGRFTIRGLPRERAVTLVVTDPGHERLEAYAATTDAPQPDNVNRINRSGKAEEIRQPVHTGAFILTAKRTDHVLTGRVLFEADGKPAAGEWVHSGLKQVKAGEDGRYRLEGLTSGPLEVHASVYRSDAAPLDVTVEIPEEPKQFERDLVLPRGLVVTGRVVDGATGRGVEKASIDFAPKPVEGRTPTHYGFSRETDSDGRFRLVVPPGRGTLTLRSVPPAYPAPEGRFIGQTADPQLSREVEGRGGQTVAVADIRLTRTRGVVLRVVDPSGKPVAGARVDVRDINRWPWFNTRPGHTDAQGRYEAIGLPPGHATVLDITADAPPLGATVEIDAEPAGGAPKTLGVRLDPLVSLSGRVLDDQGRPIAGPVLHLYRDVMYSGQNSRSFGLQIETSDEVKADGTYTFDRLIPGATYNTQVEAGGHATATSNHVKIKPGQPVRLDDFRLPATDQEVRGVVVDAHGKFVGGVNVTYQSPDRTRALGAPNGSVWGQDTDASGRFHLTGLPRGPVRLMAYRRPEGARQSIRNMKYVDVQPGQAEVRIELPDPNERLRGIE